MSTDEEIIKANTLVNTPRLEKIREFLMQTQLLPGIIAEVGVYRGGTAYLICSQTVDKVLLFDTFTGLPAVAAVDTHHKGDFNNTSIEHVANLLKPFSNYSIYKGIFPRENAEYATPYQYRLVHIDVDIYPSVKECLEFFAPRMMKKGIIILDDYNAPSCPGAKLAADEFAAANSLIVEPTVECQAIIRF